MTWFQVFQDGPEYEARKHKGTFTPPDISLKEIRAVVPPELFERSTIKSLYYIVRHLAFTFGFYYIATQIGSVARFMTDVPITQQVIRGVLWIIYWGWQGVAFAGIWCLGKSRCWIIPNINLTVVSASRPRGIAWSLSTLSIPLDQ